MTMPWENEPDREEFEHAGFPCLINRVIWETGERGHLCGYVAVPPGHPLHGKDLYSDELYDELEVHGGITYAEGCDGGIICHVPKPGEPDDVWWLGFDTAHAWDLTPSRYKFRSKYYDARLEERSERVVYRDFNYVREQTKKLAEQLAEMTA